MTSTLVEKSRRKITELCNFSNFRQENNNITELEAVLDAEIMDTLKQICTDVVSVNSLKNDEVCIFQYLYSIINDVL